MNNITTTKLSNKTLVHYIDAPQFKTINFTINFSVPLKRPDVTYNSLLPAVLRRGCTKYPLTKDLNTYLDELYGANFSYLVKKRGNSQVISFNFNFVSDKYIDDLKISDKILELAKDIFFNPLIVDNGFNEDYVSREKENLKQYIESIINDKRDYAKLRLISEMYKDENYGIFSYGYIEELEKIDGRNLYNHYKELLKNAETEMFITGSANKEIYDSFINNYFNFEKSVPGHTTTDFGKYSDNITYLSETNNINQGKLSIGFRTNVTVNSNLYFPMLILNNLYGGSVHSKLFLNVREKMSLAYYASSEYDSFKGFINVNSGIEFKNYKIALSEIFKQLEDIKNGDFTEQDIEFSKLSIITKYESIKDSAISLENFYSAQTLSGNHYTIEDMINNICKVTKEEIINAAKTVKADTVFFLKGSEEIEL